MKGFGFVQQFSRLGVAFSLLLITTFISRAQTGPPTPALTVVITTPANGETFPIGSDISISATAKDATGFINTFMLYSGSNLLTGRVIDPIFPIPTNSTETITFDWTNVQTGQYTLTAVAHDLNGLSVTSVPVNITVGLLPEVPIVSIIATDPIAVEPGTNTNHIIITPLASAASAYPSFTNYCSGTNTATFLVRRMSGIISPLVPAEPVPTNDLTVFYTIGGTASNGVDYVTLPGYVTIPAYKTFALITINPLEDVDPSNSPPFSTVILTLVPSPIVGPGPLPYRIGWPYRAGAIILEENLFPFGPPIGPCGPPLAGTPFPPFHVCFPATNGMPYCLEVSSNLAAWTPVCTNLVIKNCIQFVDPDACNLGNCYYRVVRPTAVPVY